MSEIRKDILTGEWIILADNRMTRPYDFEFSKPQKEIVKVCSFCPGNEHMTMETVYEIPGDEGWSIRVFPNKFPVVRNEFESEYSFSEEEVNIFGKANGRHEIIVDTPIHSEKICDFSKKRYYELFSALRERFRDMKKDEFIKYIHVFKNFGPSAGASISHSHWQIIGIPFVPKEPSEVYENSKKFMEARGKSIFSCIIESERSCGKRMINENEKFAAFAPYASRFGYEIDIMDKEGGESLGEFSDEKLEYLVDIFKDAICRVSKIREGICYNISFNDAPKGKENPGYSWYARIIPRMGRLAGFELGTRGYVNPVYPETAAEFYRSLKIDE